uniref:Molybdate-anion transporter n=1 Tax=Romanomermis culicivorax TaxID=13658 RepID=A0A915HDM4_ROMCU
MFTFILYALCIFCAILYFYTRNSERIAYTYDFAYFQGTYLVGYLLAAAGDWLQGPHVYALYESYGMSKHDIELLFVAGFGSSVIFGTFIGSFADKLGRRNNCILYALIYSGACVTKHFANFQILMIGRLLGGIATSILFSAFESWLVFEHNKRQYNSDLLSLLFSNATLGNSLIAILSGVVAQFAADHFGYTEK